MTCRRAPFPARRRRRNRRGCGRWPRSRGRSFWPSWRPSRRRRRLFAKRCVAKRAEWNQSRGNSWREKEAGSPHFDLSILNPCRNSEQTTRGPKSPTAIAAQAPACGAAVPAATCRRDARTTNSPTTRSHSSAKVCAFLCAPWKRVRIFEEIIGLFQVAHFSKTVRIFEQVAHLRQGLGPRVPARGCSAVVDA